MSVVSDPHAAGLHGILGLDPGTRVTHNMNMCVFFLYPGVHLQSSFTHSAQALAGRGPQVPTRRTCESTEHLDRGGGARGGCTGASYAVHTHRAVATRTTLEVPDTWMKGRDIIMTYSRGHKGVVLIVPK